MGRSVGESLNHLGVLVVAELVQFRQPEIISRVVRVLWIVGIPSQVAEELHQDESSIVLSSDQVGVFCYRSQFLSPRRRLVTTTIPSDDCPRLRPTGTALRTTLGRDQRGRLGSGL